MEPLSILGWVLRAAKLALEVGQAARAGGTPTLPAGLDLAERATKLLQEARGSRPKGEGPHVLQRRALLITAALVRAVDEVAPQGDADALAKDIEALWRQHGPEVPDPVGAAAVRKGLGAWLGRPLATPWGEALWGLLTRRQREDREPRVEGDEERRRSLRVFHVVWQALTASGEGLALEREVLSLRAVDAAALAERLVEDLAGWGAHHVFGNRRPGEDVRPFPWMPLDAVYVEPRLASGRGAAQPAQRLLREQVVEGDGVFTLVSADMGMGKTLTARRFVVERALDWLEAKDPQRWMPVYVRAADHVKAGSTDLDALVCAARERQWRDLGGPKLAVTDARLRSPEDQPLLVVIDGLDEVHLGEAEVTELLSQWHDGCSAETRRVLVFSRPGALPPGNKLPEGTLRLKVQPFDEAQVRCWLALWAALGQPGPAGPEDLPEGQRGLLGTPVLLFMTAWTFAEHGGDLPGRAALYEGFMQKVARGKVAADEAHGPIRDAALRARDALRAQGRLPDEASPEQAMLWLLGRVALELHRREQGGRALRRRELENLIEGLLGLEDDRALELVTFACVLSLQVDLRGERAAPLFGHRSFQEFLVARAWRDQLLHLLGVQDSRDREREEAALEGVLLQAPADGSLGFLLELLGALPERQREALREQARAMAEDRRVGRATDRAPHRAAEDTRAPLALAALAIGGALSTHERRLEVHTAALRRVLAWAWEAGVAVRVVARNLALQGDKRLARAGLGEADLVGAELSGVDLSGADLTGGHLSGADLSDAILSDAILSGADLSDANLSQAILSDAILSDAILYGADLSGAVLWGVSLSGAYCSDANLSGAKLTRARLTRADLSNVNLTSAFLLDANLSGANLSAANLSDAKLSGADLFETNLSGANLSAATLTRANLSGATLSGADLSRTVFRGPHDDPAARFTRDHPVWPDTLWPEGFDPEAAGCVANLPGEDRWP